MDLGRGKSIASSLLRDIENIHQILLWYPVVNRHVVYCQLARSTFCYVDSFTPNEPAHYPLFGGHIDSA